nr:immunoglobulin light chain junction region [Macaca mulatta]MOY05410.1 immunoglobulin light chain junction region [Macaca mulatta]MOY05931.1 immunoglobulin light chain junction region [Macaca mulatta]MOY06599.1 immunoglobulin light chain junction region [Macaca mulatta]MOY06902.1 immunoglobulin light chain junction region [Macaca mulatta]
DYYCMTWHNNVWVF